jgi:predicted metal-dependent hydrolase
MYDRGMNRKQEKVAALLDRFRGQALDPHYLGYFHCFNQGLFYDAHEVLEELWLVERKQSNGKFYKGLIQLAGAFVHVQKGRPQPAAALFKLARSNLVGYPKDHQRLDIGAVLMIIDDASQRLAEGPGSQLKFPKIELNRE